MGGGGASKLHSETECHVHAHGPAAPRRGPMGAAWRSGRMPPGAGHESDENSTPRRRGFGAAPPAGHRQPGAQGTFLFALDLVFLPLFARGVSIWGARGCGLHGIRAQARRREGGSLALGHSHTKCARLLSSSGQSLWLTLV